MVISRIELQWAVRGCCKMAGTWRAPPSFSGLLWQGASVFQRSLVSVWGPIITSSNHTLSPITPPDDTIPVCSRKQESALSAASKPSPHLVLTETQKMRGNTFVFYFNVYLSTTIKLPTQNFRWKSTSSTTETSNISKTVVTKIHECMSYENTSFTS